MRTLPRYAGCVGAFLGLAACQAPVAPAPYEPSTVIADVTFDDESIRELAPGSDNWPIAWAGNGHLYTTWGDGGGFGGTNDEGRVSLGIARIEGERGDYRGFNVAGGVGAPGPAPFEGKSIGILAIGDVLYLWRNGPSSNTSAFQFSRLYRSDDLGRTWAETGVEFSREGGDFQPGDNGFFSPTFLQFGQGYEDSRDQFVYTYAPELQDPTHWDLQRPGRVLLLRVSVDRIEEEAAWEYFAGTDASGAPLWSTDSAAREAVWEDSGNGAHRMAVSYNAPLGRYLLTTMAVNRDGRLAIYEAPEPWGPWSTVLFDHAPDRWGELTVVFHFVNKWLSSDGRQFVLVYTRNDRWATIEGEFILAR